MSPVAIFVYKRLKHTKELIKSLASNMLSEETDLFIFSDAAKTSIEKKDVELVRQFIHQNDYRKKFRNVMIIEEKKNKGLARSIIEGVEQIIEKYGEIIVLEDDLIVSENFLEYMNGALSFYEKCKDVWSISGYSFPMKSLVNYPHDIYYGYRGCSWGWATWKNRWEKVDWDVTSYNDFLQDKKWIKKFNRGGNDMAPMLKGQMEGKLDSWAIRWCFAQSNLNMMTVYPKKSLVENMGCDGSGTHSGNSKKFDTIRVQGSYKYRFEEVAIDKNIEKEFWKKYSDTLSKKIIRNFKKISKKLANQ